MTKIDILKECHELLCREERMARDEELTAIDKVIKALQSKNASAFNLCNEDLTAAKAATEKIHKVRIACFKELLGYYSSELNKFIKTSEQTEFERLLKLV